MCRRLGEGGRATGEPTADPDAKVCFMNIMNASRSPVILIAPTLTRAIPDGLRVHDNILTSAPNFSHVVPALGP
jgi:hypothetical protein